VVRTERGIRYATSVRRADRRRAQARGRRAREVLLRWVWGLGGGGCWLVGCQMGLFVGEWGEGNWGWLTGRENGERDLMGERMLTRLWRK